MEPIIFAYITLISGFIALLFGLAQFKPSKPAKLFHKVFGYLTLILVLFIYVFMLGKLFAGGYSMTGFTTWHVALGVLLVPILVAKWLVVRPYRAMLKLAPALGLTAFALLFAAVNLGALSRYAVPSTVPSSVEDVASAYFVEHVLIGAKCTRCHGIDVVIEAEKTAEEWDETVKRMQAKDPSWISDEEAAEIITALANAPLE
ncbi:MAG: hypothetical protein JSW52_04280 [Candidatus Coatesbacteria bacterium]|nr:MAG: hypothetical protein JSW52_04280 [Candidatus Coatesbacteria bacterium]